MLVTLCLLVACPFQALGPSVPLPETGGRYRVSDRKVTIAEARELARLASGHLLELDDEAEELAVRKALGHEPFWLGLEYPREVWASGAPVTWTHWGEGEPSHQDGASFTIAGGDETKGAWDDVRGSTERFRAVIELDDEADGEADAGPVRLARADLPARGVLLAVVEGLTQRDFENDFLAGWRGRGTLTTLAAEADPLARWGLATEGVAGAKSRLVSGGEPPAYVWFPNVLALLEELRSELHTAWLFDDPELSRLLASGVRTDVRVNERGEPQERAYEELVNQAAPMVVVLGRTLATKKGERERSLKGVESEVRIFVTAREMDPRRKSEEWLVAVVGLPARSPKAREAGDTTDRKATLVCEALGDKGKVLERAEVEVGASELRAELGVEKGVVRSGLVERRLVLDLPAKTRRVRVRLLFHGRAASTRAAAWGRRRTRTSCPGRRSRAGTSPRRARARAGARPRRSAPGPRARPRRRSAAGSCRARG